MKTTDTVIASTQSYAAKPTWGPSHRLIATAQLHSIGNQAPHFSVTGEIGRPGARDCDACGCLHEEILKAFPSWKPLVDLHLSDANGIPMHARENGWYWLAGWMQLGEKYSPTTGSFPKTPEECFSILQDHLRIDAQTALKLRADVQEAYDGGYRSVVASEDDVTPMAKEAASKAGRLAAKTLFFAFVEEQKPRWKEEAIAGLALLQSNI